MGLADRNQCTGRPEGLPMRPTVEANSRRISSPEIARRFRTLIVQAAKPDPVVFTGRVEGRDDRVEWSRGGDVSNSWEL